MSSRGEIARGSDRPGQPQNLILGQDTREKQIGHTQHGEGIAHRKDASTPRDTTQDTPPTMCRLIDAERRAFVDGWKLYSLAVSASQSFLLGVSVCRKAARVSKTTLSTPPDHVHYRRSGSGEAPPSGLRSVRGGRGVHGGLSGATCRKSEPRIGHRTRAKDTRRTHERRHERRHEAHTRVHTRARAKTTHPGSAGDEEASVRCRSSHIRSM